MAPSRRLEVSSEQRGRQQASFTGERWELFIPVQGLLLRGWEAIVWNSPAIPSCAQACRGATGTPLAPPIPPTVAEWPFLEEGVSPLENKSIIWSNKEPEQRLESFVRPPARTNPSPIELINITNRQISNARATKLTTRSPSTSTSRRNNNNHHPTKLARSRWN